MYGNECTNCKVAITQGEKKTQGGLCKICFETNQAEERKEAEREAIACNMETLNVKELEKRITGLEKSNVNLGWKLGELEKELAEVRKPVESEITRDSIMNGVSKWGIKEWIRELKKMEKDRLVTLDHKDCGELANILKYMLERMY